MAMKAVQRSLTSYRAKRNFSRSPEPKGATGGSRGSGIFVVQKHLASHLHYDFRLGLNGVLKSWAIPKGPSLNPSVRRLAIETEDHPFEYRNFEGTIPAGQYGAGEVIVWDRGRYRPSEGGGETEIARGLRRGHLSIELKGHKLNGGFTLVRLKQPKQWLLIKKQDDEASPRDVTKDNRSVKSARTLSDAKPKRKAS